MASLHSDRPVIMTDLNIFLHAPEGASPEELAAYLDEACAGDPDLRARVEELFAADGETEAIADQAPRMPGEADREFATSVEAPGTVIGPYKLLQKIGEGGFGDVYMADQLHPVKRRVAFKIIKLGMDTRQVVARFEAERQALAMMDHPNIAKVHDAGATETGRPYFVMELVRGIPITTFCDQQHLDTTERLELFIDVCHAVQHAHQKGVIHRDLKPGNVMVTMHDDRPVVKVIDFGVAKAMQTDLTDKTLFTKFEQFIGTPVYMSPEQAQFSGLDIDTRSDIYTLGVLLYELLTGTTPFDSREMNRAGYDEIRRIIKEEEPVLPSSRVSTCGKAELSTLAKNRRTGPSRLPSLLRGDLDWIVMKAIEKDRTRRYETANALAADIGRHLADEPVNAAAPSASYRLRKYVHRHRALLGTAAVVVTSLLVGTTVSLWKAIEASRASAVAEDATRSEREQHERSQEQERRARHRLAEEQFAAGKPALGIAHLARLLREDRTNVVAAERMLTAIRMHPLPEPLRLFPDAGVRVAKLNGDGSLVALGLRDRTVVVRDTATGARRGGLMTRSGEGQLESIQFSPDGRQVMALSMRPGEELASTAEIFDWQTGDRVCSPLFLDAKAQTCLFSPDGKLVLMGCPGRTCVWDLATGEPCFPPFNEGSYGGVFSPDSQLIVFTSGRVYSARSGEKLAPLSNGIGYALRFSPDGTRIVGGSSGGFAKVWDVQSREVVARLNHEDDVPCAEFSPDGRVIVTGSHDGILRLWDATSFERIREFTHPRGRIDMHGVAFSGDGRRVIGSFMGETWVWDIHGRGEGMQVSLVPRLASVSELSPDNRFVLTSGGIGKWRAALSRFSPNPPRCQIFRHHENSSWDPNAQGIREVDLSPDGKRLLTGATANWVGMWDARTGKREFSLVHKGGVKERAEFSSDGSLILTVTAKLDGGGVKIWDAESGELLQHLRGEGVFRHVAFSPRRVEGDYLFVAAPEGVSSARFYRVRADEPEPVPVGAALTYGGPLNYGDYPRLLRAVFSPDATRIVTTSLEGHARVWSVPEGDLLQELGGHHTAALISAMFSADGRRIVTASEDGTAGVWADTSDEDGAADFEFVGVLRHGGEPVLYAEFSPDGERVVTASQDGSARIWTRAGDIYQPSGGVLRHEDVVHLAKFSPNGRRVLTVSVDETARVWDARTGLPLSEPLRHDGIVFDAMFSWDHDGARVITAGQDTTARLWDLPPAPPGRVPAWVAAWGEAVAGLRIDGNGAIKLVPVPERLEARRRALAAADDHYYARTARWFYADRETRPITPFSEMLLADWIENRVGENRIASFHEALRVAPDDRTVQLALARALMNSGGEDQAMNLKRAGLLAQEVPDGPEREDLLRQIDRAGSSHALNQRFAALEAEARVAMKSGDHRTVGLLLSPLALGKILVAAEDDGVPDPVTEARLQELMASIGPAPVLVPPGAEWRYLDTNEDPGPGWTQLSHDDSDWKAGPAPLGLGKGEEGLVTTLPGEGTWAVSYYFRHEFEAPAEASHQALQLWAYCDDGAVFYLNGEELGRENMPAGAIGHETQATKKNSERIAGPQWMMEIDPGLIRPGKNVLAVEVHQYHGLTTPSSDLRLELELGPRIPLAAHLASLSDEELQDALSLLLLSMPGEHASSYRERWEPVLASDRMPETGAELAFRARVQKAFGRREAELAALDAAISAFPAQLGASEVREQVELLRRKVDCLERLGEHAAAEMVRASLSRFPKGPDPDSLQLDLRGVANVSLYKRKSPVRDDHQYWLERLPEIFDPGDGPGFHFGGFLQLNSGVFPADFPAKRFAGRDYAADHGFDLPDRISIPIGRKFGAIHFLQAARCARHELPGVEIAHYLVHYDDRSTECIPVINGRDTTHGWIHDVHDNLKRGVDLVVQQEFTGSWGGKGTLGFARQSWTNPHPEKTVTRLEFISNKVKAAPFVAGITLETHEDVRQRTEGFEEELAKLEVDLRGFTDLHDPATLRKQRTLLRRKLQLLTDLGFHERAAAVDEEIASVPPRPPGLPAEQIDLTAAYTQSFFRPGPRHIRHRDRFWEQIPEFFDPGEGPAFDLRGVVQLDSGVYSGQQWPLNGRVFGQHYGLPSHTSRRIEVARTFRTIHFLHTALFGREERGVQVASYVLHYEDGTSHPIPVFYGEHIIDNANVKEVGMLGDDARVALKMKTLNQWGDSGTILLTRQTAENPHPEKRVTHIQFESAEKMAAPCLAGITVE